MSVKVDLKEFEEFQKNFAHMQTESDEIVLVCIKDLAKRMFSLVSNPEITPVDTGHLRGSWGIGPITKTNGGYEVEIINPVEYAKYVEYGHRIVKSGITIGWVEGRFMMTISEMEIEKHKDRLIKKRVQKWLREKLR